jgi:hypothetical protein
MDHVQAYFAVRCLMIDHFKKFIELKELHENNARRYLIISFSTIYSLL